ncbi:DNA-dependent protein kinase catalytic subunit isoform X2 [Xylocopa sonorina]|uniref:DNA-dependent protein kinase catalytic subunit isoform X2 n=1 Tax=Xylocopa sonorina TaxID=1818115 RepID=UPI00403AA368
MISACRSQSNHTFQVYLDVISDILNQLPHDVREKHRQELYGWVKEFSSPTRYSEKMITMRSAVNLLSRHMNIFREFIYRDYKYWNHLLVDLASNKNVQNSECGQRALKNFYRTIGSILKDKTFEDDKTIFLYFKQQFEESLTPNSGISSNMLRFIVYGYSQMASACKTYQINEGVRNMFSCIANCVMPLCLRDDTENVYLEDICDYQEALSEIILYMPDLSIDQINIITRLNTLLVKRFPDLPITSQNLAISSLINMIISIGVISKSLLDECLYNLIHEGIAWSCSHTLLVDAELQRGLYDLEELPICYKKYVPLWTQLLNPDRYREHTRIAQDIVDSTMHASMVLIGKLNLTTKMKEDNMFSDAVYSQIAENEADFRTFVNIVDLYVDMISKLKVSSLLLNTIHNFLLKMISMSYKNPLISGFYKLVHATFKHISNLMDENEIETKTQLMLYKYLTNVLDLIPTFSNELLTTCLRLILDMPITYVKQILNSTIPTFKIAFTIGVSDFELACTALDSLEKWRNHMDNQDMIVFLQEIVPFLEPYLRSGESSVEFLQDIIKTERKVIKQIILKDEITLEKFQRRVLLFIASLDTGIITNFMYKRSTETGATWDKKDLLEYSLTLPDTNVICQVNINFDKILPRLILLAQNSGDRRTKINACEVLHSITALVLGKTSQRLAFNPDQFVPIYMVLCPALLNLGCDYDETTRKMFQPLMLQLTHWLSSKFMLKSSASMHFIDTLFKGLSNDSNSSLREFSGMCLAEFTKWSIKQSTDNGNLSQTNIYGVIYKMTSFALHPSASKRIAAATAFNHLYKTLRENKNIVSVYWLEILYSFVTSLDGCNDRSIITALDHVERVVITKKDLLNERHSHRKATFQSERATLLDAVNWLLVQCGSLDQCCRAKSMELVIKLSEHVENCDSAESMIKNYIDSCGIEAFNGIILSNLEPKIEGLSVKGLLPLLRSLDCYIWLMKNNLLDAKYLFNNSSSQREVFFDCASNFICLVNKIKIEDDGDNLVILTKEIEDLQTLQCKTILTTLEFIQILLDSGFQDNFFPDCFFNKDLYELIAKCIICPYVIGFDAKNLEITEALPKTLESLLQSITRKTDSFLLRLINSDLSIYVDKHINDFINLDEIVSNMSCCSELKEYVRGLIVLEHHNILNKLHNATKLIHRPEDKVTCIFNVLARRYLGELVCVNLKPTVKDYLETLMGFLLMHYEPSMTKTLIALIENNTILNAGSRRIEHGIHFLNTFKDEIFRYMLMDTEKTVEMLNELQKNPFFLLTITEQLLLFVQRHKKQLHHQAEFLANTMIKKFTMFKSAVSSVENGKQKLINIFGIAVHLKREPIHVLSMNEDFYTWILSQLLENSDIEYKIYILQNFLVCLTDMTSDTKPELLSILYNLGNNLNVSPDDFSQRNANALRVINCFQKLVTLLPITKSVATLKSVISFATGIAEHLCNDKTSEYLEKYFASITTDYAFESLQAAYKLFMESDRGVKERFDVLYKFLLPSFGFCKLPEIRRFFEENIKEIHTVICQKLVGTVSYVNQLITSKIGCYDLVAIMFCKVSINDIDDTDSVITRNAVDNVETGKELLLSLYKNTLNVRKLKRPEPELKEPMRLLHCSAYNCSIAIVSSYKKDQDSYLILFGENREKEQLIWENIVDCEKRYNFQQTVTEFPKYRKRLINIRKSMKQRQISTPYSYIYSYDLAASTLNEDINAYDFNETTVRSKPITEEESMSLTFESDELNNHECMATVCGVLTHMLSEEIFVPDTDEDNTTIHIPAWLSCFLKSMLRTNYDNVRLFMLKIVLNMQTVFQPYAKFFLKPIMQTTHSYLGKNEMNYIIVDVIEMLMNWQTASFEKSSRPIFDAKDKGTVQQLWEIIIHKVIVSRSSEITKAIYKYNLNLVKTMLEVWHTYLQLPSNLKEKMSNAPGAAMYLILICFVNGMEKDIVQKDDILQYLDKSVEDWKGDEETVLQCYECYGFVLKYLDGDDRLTNRKCAIMDKIQSILRKMQLESKDRLMKCIRALCKNYPAAATATYFDFVVPNMFKVDGQVKSNCLEIFRQCIPDLNAAQIVKELNYMKFHDFLKNRSLTYERIALKMIDSLVLVLPASILLSLATLAIPYTRHEFSEYREITYSIFIKSYKKYATDNSEDEEIKKLMNISKEILLDGVLDPAEKLQEMILNFWTADAQLESTCKERLLEILTMYTSKIGQNFLPFLLLLILDLTKNTNYNEKMFSEPLYDCNYADYNISASWRTRNLGSKTPFFVPSLTSQMNQMFTQTSSESSNVNSDFTYTKPVYEYDAEWQLQETQAPEFEPTYVAESSMTTYKNLEQDGIFKVPKVPEPAHNKRSKRFLSSSTDISRVMRQKQIKKNKRREEMIKEEDTRQRSSVKLYRKYRIGDFPDIEILHAALIEPLQQLAKNDQLICKDLIVSITCSLIEDKSFAAKLEGNVKRIVEDEQGSNSTIPALLEILLHSRITICSSEAIVKVSKSNGLNFHGSCVLENNLIYKEDNSEPPNKRMRNKNASDSSSDWLLLSNLYESMNDVDVVLSIFQNHISNEDMRSASLAQASNDWGKAKLAYEEAYNTESELIREHCLQGLFECLSNLCNWNEIDKYMKEKLNGNLDNIWDDPRKDWMFPWLLEVQIHKLLNEDCSDEFYNNVQIMESWLRDDAKVKHIKRLYGNELSLFVIHSNVEGARDFLLNTLDEVREEWIRLHPLSTQLGVRKLQKLRITNDVDRFIKVFKTRTPCNLNEILKFWNNSMPSAQDALVPWDKLTSYRLHFINTLLSNDEETCKEEDSMQVDTDSYPNTEENGIIRRMHATAFTMGLKMIEAAFDQGNRYVAKKYGVRLEKIIKNYSIDKKHEIPLVHAKIKYLMGETETDVTKKLSSYVSSWKHYHKLLRQNDLEDTLSVNTRKEISKLSSRIAKLSEDETFAKLLMTNSEILKDINVETHDLSVIQNALETYSFDHLKTCCNMTTTNKNVGESFFSLAKYCYDRLSYTTNDVQLSKEFVHSILKAMSAGSLEAAHYFPCLLKPEYFNDQETKEIFMNESKRIETWRFLSWQAQLFSHLGTSIAPLIIPILKRIVEEYPNAVIYTFRLTVETNPALLEETSTYDIRQLIYNRPEIERFLTAMQYVVQPELYLKHYLLECRKNLSLGQATAVNMLMEKVYPNARENKHDVKPGAIFDEIQMHKSKIKDLQNSRSKDFERRLDAMIQNISQLLQRRKDRLKLKDYSPWLCNFPEKDIEIPGQYTGNRKPMPQYHTKIIKFEPTVKVMRSMRKPIRITMIGNDAKEYHFLTKFGEDLRQDQRLQQLFNIMNKTLHADATCKQRQLSVDTYQVIPLSKTVGLIQWVDNTRSLQELINFNKTKQDESISIMYGKWIQDAAPNKKGYEIYKEAVLKYKAAKVIAKMNEFISKTEWDSLRKTLTVLCPSVESFVTMRRNFITSYATMCIAHWILGIGDRHLENTLVTVDSGRCLGIDFGFAFDAGVNQRIPELMPFRLTSQILGLLKPFTENDLLGMTMVHVLRTLRNDQGPILSCMDVFVHEPLNWTQHVNRGLSENDEDATDVKWVPMRKIQAVTKKLNGIKPSLITIDQLKEQHNDKYFDRYYVIVTGDDEDNKRTRARMGNNCLTVAEQVECLLDQATDLNILGRTFVGWKPWL